MAADFRYSRRPIMAWIKEWEKFQAHSYICPGGWPTIGYGHVIKPGESFNHPLSEAEGAQLLLNDLKRASLSIHRLIQVPLTAEQQDALLSFTFNVGAGALQRSALRCKINRYEHQSVPQELLRWVWAGGRKHRGLIKRRTIEGLIYANENSR